MGALERIFKMLDYEPKIKNYEGNKLNDDNNLCIEFKDVSFTYPRTNVEILHSINLKIEPGECVAFVGASGSGKSTIIKLIERFYDTTSGCIEINCENIKNLDS